MRKVSLALAGIVILTSCVWLTCGDDPRELSIQNNSDIGICYHFHSIKGWPTPPYPYILYPDTTISFGSIFLRGPIEPKQLYETQEYVEYAYSEQDTVSLFIFDERLYKQEVWVPVGNNDGHFTNPTWDKAIEDYDILVRYDLSKEDMDRCRQEDGVIVLCYPPDERMKDIKMWPPYEEAIKQSKF